MEKQFYVSGMSCAACAARVNKVLNSQEGVLEADVNLASASAKVKYNPDKCSPQQLRQAVQNAGYDLIIEDENSAEEIEREKSNSYKKLKRETILAIAFALPVMLLSMLFMRAEWVKYLVWVLSTVVVFGFGARFYKSAWNQLKHRSSNMDTLVAVSTGIAYLFSLFNLFFSEFWLNRGIEPHLYFEASSVIIAFILLGRLLESRSKEKTSGAIKKLMGLKPKSVTIIRNGEQLTLPVEQAKVGDEILVKPGEKIALDGQVVHGSSYVDESMLNGEPLASFKEVGSKVFAGSINQKGTFRFVAEKTGEQTTLSQIIKLVQQAQGSKAPVQQVVDKIASIFVPTIIIISVVVFFIWLIAAPGQIEHAILAMVTVLIIACPCALGLATPTAIIVGIGKGATEGILIKDAVSLEVARKIDSVILDKTGTITEGNPKVIKEFWSGNKTAERVLYELEQLSEHPVASAVVEALKERLAASEQVEINKFENIPGGGVKGEAGGVLYYAGNREFISAAGVAVGPEAEAFLNETEERGATIVCFANSEELLALMAVSDTIKATSAAAISRLQKMGIEVYMLTGDNHAAAASVAKEAGIKHFKASILPAEKAGFVKELQKEGHKVAMVGDGINDSAALAQADLSIAMGRGSDIAMDAAMVTILSSDLEKIPQAIRLSQLVIKTLHQNLFWAFIYNIIAIPIAAGILYPINGFLLNPMIGGAAMAFSSVSVVTNSLRLRGKRIGTVKESDKINNKRNDSKKIMRQEFKVSGMMCNHCRTHVENALNSIDGVTAKVTLEPPVAVIESEREISKEELQKVVSQQAGEYLLS